MHNSRMKSALLIPAYKPRERTLPFLKSFKGDEFDFFLVVDDGSGKEYADLFSSIEKETPFKVISYPVNKGKGGALKEGIAYYSNLKEKPDFIITADCDGQHLYKDIMRLKEEASLHNNALILGNRTDLYSDDVPIKSIIGNKMGKYHVKLLTGRTVNDTQTGLRAIPSSLYPLALAIDGKRYEYEFSFLFSAMEEAEVRFVDVETIYMDNNADTHYRPIRDTVRIFGNSILRLFIALVCFGLDIGVFALHLNVLPARLDWGIIGLASLIGRLFSGIIFSASIAIFATPNRNKRIMNARNCLIGSMAMIVLSTAIVYPFSLLFENTVAIKIIVELALGAIMFLIHRTYVIHKWKKK